LPLASLHKNLILCNTSAYLKNECILIQEVSRLVKDFLGGYQYFLNCGQAVTMGQGLRAASKTLRVRSVRLKPQSLKDCWGIDGLDQFDL
jgi:hypothetical protein